MDWTRGGSGIAGGAPVEVDYAFIQFAGFTFGKAVSQFDPQWALSKPYHLVGLQRRFQQRDRYQPAGLHRDLR